MRLFLKSCVRFYKLFVSPILTGLWGAQCCYEVSCSQYAEQLLKEEGLSLGFVLKKILFRFLSCHPFTKISHKVVSL